MLHHQPPLLEETPLSGWLPDETLFSWCSRYHRISSHHLAETTTKALFKHRYRGSAHDFPSRIDNFVECTGGSLGSAESIIRERTILPAFIPFQTPEVTNLAVAAMRGRSIGSLKYRLGLLTGHFRANFPLKTCSQCLASDLAQYNTVYWHLSHQWPGVWVCVKHNQLLSESTLKSTGAQRFGWLLPDEHCPRALEPQLSDEGLSRLTQISNAAVALASTPAGLHFDSGVLSVTLHARLHQRDLASASGRLDTQGIGQAFHAFISPIRGLDDFQFLATNHTTATTQACGYFHRLQRVTHPLRHLLAIVWLYEDWSTFLVDYQSHLRSVNDSKPASVSNALASSTPIQSINSELRTACVQLSTEQNISATAIASQLNVNVATVITHLAAAGIQTPKRPKVLRGEKREALRLALREGLSKKEASQKFSLSIETVTRFLLSEVGLHQEWTAKRFEIDQQRSRTSWSELLSGNQGANVKLLRSIAPGVYAWLYRHDREWLNSSNQTRRSLPFSGGRRVDWQARDDEMAELAQRALNTLSASKPGKSFLMTDLVQLAPQIKPFVNKLDLLPRTQNVLNQRVRHRTKNSDGLFDEPNQNPP